MIIKKDIELNPFLSFDYTIDNNYEKWIPLVFLHGFKGFKDWGHYPLMANEFAEKGYAFFKLNFSHNGVIPPNLTDFNDLDAFGKNTFSKEIVDLKRLIEWIFNNPEINNKIEYNQLTLIGHSRGGATATIYSSLDHRIRKLITLAGVADLSRMLNPRNLDEWKNNGVIYTLNTRTNQKMPLNISLREDYYANIATYEVLSAAKKIQIPALIIHGDNDEAVPLDDAYKLNKNIKNSQLAVIKNANHTFNGKHPFIEKQLPEKVIEMIELINNFIKT